MLYIENDGASIVNTNYWETEMAKHGYVYCSINAGCFRLLVPEKKGISLDDLQSGHLVIVTRAPWPAMGVRDALELLFEDDSDTPFALHIVSRQVDRMPLDTDADQPGQPPKWRLAIYTQKGCVRNNVPVRYRIEKKLPCLDPWGYWK